MLMMHGGNLSDSLSHWVKSIHIYIALCSSIPHKKLLDLNVAVVEAIILSCHTRAVNLS
jgi:hypothetical protein